MSFGFSIGDFAMVAELAWRLYRDCYRVARGAPQEFQLLVGEISNLSNALAILKEEVQDPDSTLRQAGEGRIHMMNQMITGIHMTLKGLEDVAKRFEMLGSNSRRKQLKAKFLWSFDFSSIENQRHKLVYHNGIMNLLLTSVGNSSLQRIESSNATRNKDIDEIKEFISSSQNVGKSIVPWLSLSVIDDEQCKMSLSAALMRSAEVSQPWNTIGLDQWVEAGRWWFLRSRMELFAISRPRQSVPATGYINLIKASWILIDVIARHPQASFITTGTDAEIQLLCKEIKNEFTRLSDLDSICPNISSFGMEDVRIWETMSKGSILQTHKDSRNFEEWTARGELVMFKQYASCMMRSHTVPFASIVLFLVHKDARGAGIVALNQGHLVIMSLTFQTRITASVDGACATVDDQKLLFDNPNDARLLDCLVQATNFYLFDRNSSGFSLDDLRAYYLIFAKSNGNSNAVTRLMQRAPLKDYIPCEGADNSPCSVALTLVSQNIRSELLIGSGDTEFPYPICLLAILSRSSSLVRLLICEKVNFGFYWFGRTALGLAASSGCEEIVQTLLQNEYPVNETDSESLQALHYAAINGHEKIVRLLWEHGANIEEDGLWSLEPLYYAASNGHHEIVKFLLECGADGHASDHFKVRTFKLAAGLDVQIYSDDTIVHTADPKIEQALRGIHINLDIDFVGCEQLAQFLLASKRAVMTYFFPSITRLEYSQRIAILDAADNAQNDGGTAFRDLFIMLCKEQ